MHPSISSCVMSSIRMYSHTTDEFAPFLSSFYGMHFLFMMKICTNSLFIIWKKHTGFCSCLNIRDMIWFTHKNWRRKFSWKEDPFVRWEINNVISNTNFVVSVVNSFFAKIYANTFSAIIILSFVLFILWGENRLSFSWMIFHWIHHIYLSILWCKRKTTFIEKDYLPYYEIWSLNFHQNMKTETLYHLLCCVLAF